MTVTAVEKLDRAKTQTLLGAEMGNALKKVVTEEATVQEIAAAAVEKSAGDIVKAASIMEAEVSSSDSLYRALMDPLLAQACYSAVSAICRKERKKIWVAPNYQENTTGRVHALASGNLLLFPLPGGKRLGEATRADVIAAAEFYRKQAEDMGHKAAWLGRIGDSLQDEQTVSNVFTESSLRKLQEEITNV